MNICRRGIYYRMKIIGKIIYRGILIPAILIVLAPPVFPLYILFILVETTIIMLIRTYDYFVTKPCQMADCLSEILNTIPSNPRPRSKKD